MQTIPTAIHESDSVRKEASRRIRILVLFVLLFVVVPLLAQDLGNHIACMGEPGIRTNVFTYDHSQTSLKINVVRVAPVYEIFSQMHAQPGVSDRLLRGPEDGTPDTTTGVEPADTRILTLFGGVVFPRGNGVGTSTIGPEAMNPGYLLGADAGLRLGSNLRVVLSGMKGWIPTELPAVARKLGAIVPPPTSSLTCILGGLQYRSEGRAEVKPQCEVLLGWMLVDHSSFALSNHADGPQGSGSWVQNATTSKGFAYGFGVGSRIDRFTLMARGLIGDLRYTTSIRYLSSNREEVSEDNTVMLIVFAVGCEIF